jgi:glycosyltransferase involved in cell wall biosynthesis
MRETVLVYRHRLIPPSEAAFVGRFYSGFKTLAPVWLGYHLDSGVRSLTDHPLRVGRDGIRGAVDRAMFRHLGVVPPEPDLGAIRPRVIHALFGRGGAMALPIARALHVPLVVTFLGADATKDKHYRHHLIPHVYERRLAALQREAVLFVCLSGFLRDKLIARGFPPEKVEVIHHGTVIDDATTAPTAPAASSGEPYVLFAGRFVEKKGVTHLLAAMRRLDEQGRGARLVLVGDGPLGAQLRQQGEGMRRVEFRGWLPNAELRQHMRGALAVCVPSVTATDGDAEGLPTVVFEAMAAGVPVVATTHAGIPEAIDHDVTGLLVPEADPAALAEALAAVIARSELRARLGAAARDGAVERFDAARQSRRLEEALLRVSEPVRG